MSMKLSRIFGGIVFCIVMAACHEVVVTPCPIDPLYASLDHYNTLTEAQRDSLLSTDSLEIDMMFRILGKDFVWEKTDTAGNEKELPDIHEVLEHWVKSRVVKTFTLTVDSVFPNLAPIEDKMGLILENAANEDFKIPEYKYVAVVWNLRHPIVFADTLCYIALNHFLGSDFSGYDGLHQYERQIMSPQQLPYVITEALVANNYPYVQTETSTALSRMMYEGALTYIKLKLVPEATLAATLGYTTKQLEWLDSHYKEMWETLIGKDVLYSTSRDVTKRLVEPAPFTGILSPDSPGRAGRYLGYRLILNYMQNNAKTSLTYLLSPEFYNNPSVLVLAQ